MRERRYRNETGIEVVEQDLARPVWQADAWFLERRFQERWAKQARRKHEIEMSAVLTALLATWEPVALCGALATSDVRPPWQGEEAGDDEEDGEEE